MPSERQRLLDLFDDAPSKISSFSTRPPPRRVYATETSGGRRLTEVTHVVRSAGYYVTKDGPFRIGATFTQFLASFPSTTERSRSF